MRKSSIDTVLTVKLRHRPGQLARLAQAIADEKGLLGEIRTVRIGEEDTVREITVETQTEDQTERMLAAVRRVDGAEIIEHTDRVYAMHKGGKMHATSRVKIAGPTDLRYIYTPGVARVSRAIAKDIDLAWEFTGVGNSVGIFTNGTRVLGLGDIGPVASLPVMEGKAVLYDAFAGISATPILVDTKDPAAFVETVALVSGSFGGIHLEDIRVPDCFEIEAELVRRLDKPVMHDDQHGTATAALAAILNACALVGKDPKRARIGQIGLGAAGTAIAKLAMAFGAADVLVTDPRPESYARVPDARAVDLETLLGACDIVIAATGKPGLIPPSLVRKGQILLALSNPDAEIDPNEALAAGAAFASDGRSVNNALAFPGLFRGALDVKSSKITRSMMIAAAEAIAKSTRPGEVVPSPLDPEVHQAVRAAVVETAKREGLAGTARLERTTTEARRAQR